MLRQSLVAAVVCAAVIVALVSRSAAEPGKEGSRNSASAPELLERIARLEARVAELERRTPLTTLTQVPGTNVVPYTTFGGAAQYPPPAAPESWTPREFNGLRYFIVPLKPGREPIAERGTATFGSPGSTK